MAGRDQMQRSAVQHRQGASRNPLSWMFKKDDRLGQAPANPFSGDGFFGRIANGQISSKRGNIFGQTFDIARGRQPKNNTPTTTFTATRSGSNPFASSGLPSRAESQRIRDQKPRGFEDLVGSPRGAEETMQRRLQQLDADFATQKAELSRMFSLAETPQEQAQLAFVLGDLEEQQKAGRVIISNEFGQAQQFANAQAATSREAAVAQGDAMSGLFADSASRASAGIADIAGDYENSGLGVGSVPVSGDATDWVGLIEGVGASQAALSRQMGDLAAEDQAFLATQLGQEGGAQQGALERAALGIRADSIGQHQQQVNARVAQERMMKAQMLADLQSQVSQRRFDVESRTGEQDHRYEQDRRDWLLGQEQQRLDRANQRRAASQVVPRDPIEQLVWLGQMSMELGGPQFDAMLRGLVEQGVLDAQVASGFIEGGL